MDHVTDLLKVQWRLTQNLTCSKHRLFVRIKSRSKLQPVGA